MRFLVVLAHPLRESFAASVAEAVVTGLEDRNHEVDLLDLYAEDFDPRLTAVERATDIAGNLDLSAVAPLVERLRAADGIILVFPQWWFNLPAILKGFFDRVFAYGVAFNIDRPGGPLVPQLRKIKYFWAFTTTGSRWWIVHLYMGNPVKRLLKRAISAACMKSPDFRMLSLHDMDRSTDDKRKRFLDRVRREVSTL